MPSRPNSPQGARGFTLLELVVVICIVALLIFFSVDYFRRAVRAADATAVSMNGRALLDGTRAAHLRWLVENRSGAVYDLPRFGRGDVDTGAAGFPAGTSRKPGDRLTVRHCAEIWLAVTHPNPEQEGVAALSPFKVEAGSGKNATCHYSYRRDERMYVTYDPRSGEVRIYADAR